MKKDVKSNNKKKKKKRSKVRVFFRVVLLIILALIIGYGIWFGVNYSKHITKGEENHYDPLSATALGIDPEKLKEVGRINVLILGESGYEDDYKLTDSIMVASYNPQTQQASMLSIPRDTYVGRKDKNSATPNYLASYKMNSVYRNGTNIPETITRVEELVGIKIHNYVLVDTDAIVQIVDAIGGVNFNVPIDMNYDDTNQNLHIHLKAGEQLIDGAKAEQLLRFRHNQDWTSYPEEYGDNDLGRMRTQREFIQATLKQLIRFENVTKVLNLLDIVFNNVKTDLTLETIKYYIPYAFKFNMENIKSGMVPGESQKCNGIWIYVANKKQTKQIADELFTDILPQEPVANTIENTNSNEENKKEEKIKIELLNGTGQNEKLEEVKQKLIKEGYDVIKSGNTNSTSNSVIINRTMQSKNIEDDLKEILNIKNINSNSNNSNIDFTIIIGKDYE